MGNFGDDERASEIDGTWFQIQFLPNFLFLMPLNSTYQPWLWLLCRDRVHKGGREGKVDKRNFPKIVE